MPLQQRPALSAPQNVAPAVGRLQLALRKERGTISDPAARSCRHRTNAPSQTSYRRRKDQMPRFIGRCGTLVFVVLLSVWLALPALAPTLAIASTHRSP